MSYLTDLKKSTGIELAGKIVRFIFKWFIAAFFSVLVAWEPGRNDSNENISFHFKGLTNEQILIIDQINKRRKWKSFFFVHTILTPITKFQNGDGILLSRPIIDE